jgi:predicted lactoylglutathione lyase
MDDTALFMVWSESINVMLLTHAKWRTTYDPTGSAEKLERGRAQCVVRSHEKTSMQQIAFENGILLVNPVEDHGRLYTHVPVQ